MNKHQTYGYIRVSSRDQNEDRQRIALSACNISGRNLFVDKQSGKDFDRPAYQRMIKKLKANDLVIVQSIDRLGRNYEDILDQWRIITKKICADIRVLDMPILDTSIRNDLTGTLVADIVLQLLSYVAQKERENIKKRQAEGIAAAKARGVQFGRKEAERPQGFKEQADLWMQGAISAREAARRLGISHQTFLRKIKKDEGDSCQK